jgi:hypothetical protein
MIKETLALIPDNSCSEYLQLLFFRTLERRIPSTRSIHQAQENTLEQTNKHD